MTELTADEKERIATLVFLVSRHANRAIAVLLHWALVSGSTWQEANENIVRLRENQGFIDSGVKSVEESLGKLEEYEVEIFHDIFVSEIDDHLDFAVEPIEEPLTGEIDLLSHPTLSSQPVIPWETYSKGLKKGMDDAEGSEKNESP
ncbi:MAG: hypothetical protein OXN19_16100 [Caldilineaceae bacterium]|nr:hypothetical protein [Caldilineaceae bacterium]